MRQSQSKFTVDETGIGYKFPHRVILLSMPIPRENYPTRGTANNPIMSAKKEVRFHLAYQTTIQLLTHFIRLKVAPVYILRLPGLFYGKRFIMDRIIFIVICLIIAGVIQEHGGVMKLTQAERILALLQRRRGWVNFRDLNGVCFRYGGRIFDTPPQGSHNRKEIRARYLVVSPR